MITVKLWQLFVAFAFGWRGYWIVYHSMKDDYPKRKSLDGIEYALCWLIALVGVALASGFIAIAHNLTIIW